MGITSRLGRSACCKLFLLIAAIGACSGREQERVNPVKQSLILDQVHNGGPKGFYWLPPIVAQPSPEGQFDGTLSPTVQIDEIDPQTQLVLRTVATFTTTSGPGGERVHVEANDPIYRLDWHTDGFGISTTRIYRIRVLVAGREVGIADVQPVANGADLRNVDTNEVIGLIDGRTLPIKFWMNRCAPVACLASDQCHTAGVCDVATGTCSNPVKPDGSSCSDGNACTQTDACQAGVCAGGTATTCVASDQCHGVGVCDPGTGICSNPTKPDGEACSDGDLCTQTDACLAGSCVGSSPVSCVAQDQCHTAGICDSSTGMCTSPPKADGTTCADGDACTQSDTCQAGVCQGTQPVVCVAADQCHGTGICDSITGVCSNPARPDGTSCSDGNACSTVDTCQAGACTGSDPVTCTVTPGCTTAGSCDPATGTCSASTGCNLCGNGTLNPPEQCDDGNTVDGDGCSSICAVERCFGVTCVALDQCHSPGTCDPATGACSNPAKPDGSSCDDASRCTSSDSCQAGACVGTTAVTCSSPDQCRQGMCDPNTGTCVAPGKADGIACTDGNAMTSDDRCLAGLCIGQPIRPSSTSQDLTQMASRLTSGPTPVQPGLSASALDVRRTAIVRGKVSGRDGSPLAAVTIRALGQPQFGSTLTRIDGGFDFVVNGGGTVTLDYRRVGYLSVQRTVRVPWQDYAHAPDLVMISVDPRATTIALGSSQLQVAEGSVVSDADGTRQAVVLVPGGTTAEVVGANGQATPASSLTIRATEHTVGPSGPKAMPSELPPTTGYTYAVSFTADEALASGARSVRFSQALPVYVDDFIGFPVGSPVPSGFYDPERGAWLPSANGRVVRVLSTAGGQAELDVDGSGTAASNSALASLGITDAERAALAGKYAIGRVLWRVPISHFSPYDFNWPAGPPAANEPPSSLPPTSGSPGNESRELCGSALGAENQTLGETVAITGTRFTFNYRSDRVPGFKAANSLIVPLFPEGFTPFGPIKTTISIRGNRTELFAGNPPLPTQKFTWDGKDRFGQPVRGRQPVTIDVGFGLQIGVGGGIGYEYIAFGSIFGNLFGTLSGQPLGVPVRPTDDQTVYLKRESAFVGIWDARGEGLGGWTLSPHHALDSGQTLFRGDGDQEDAIPQGGVTQRLGFDGGGTFAIAPDGSLWGFVTGFSHPVRLPRDSSNSQLFFPSIGNPYEVAVSPTGGDVYYASRPDDGANETHIYKFNPAQPAFANVVAVIPGAPFRSMILGDDFFFYFTRDHRIFRAHLDSASAIAPVAGSDSPGASGDGGPVANATFNTPTGLARGKDGSLYVADAGNHKVRKISRYGFVTTVAGTGQAGFSGDGGLATQARLNEPVSVAVDQQDNVYVADKQNARVRVVQSDSQVILTAVGSGSVTIDTAGKSGVDTPLRTATRVAVATDRTLFVYDGLPGVVCGICGGALIRFRQPAGRIVGFDVLIASADGREIFVFDRNGRHRQTLDSLTGGLIYTFEYDPANLLIGIRDSQNLVTRIERDGAGNATAVVAPGGQRTSVVIGPDGYLARIANPAGEAFQFSYVSDGLLQTMIDPRNRTREWDYDEEGRLLSERRRNTGVVTLVRDPPDIARAFEVSTTSPLGRSRLLRVQQDLTGGLKRTNVNEAGLASVEETAINGSVDLREVDGTRTVSTNTPDPRFQLKVALTSSTATTPAGVNNVFRVSRTASFNSQDPVQLSSQTDTMNMNGQVWTDTYQASTRSVSRVSPRGRSRTMTLDAGSRVATLARSGLEPIVFAYDPRGRIDTVRQGSGTSARVFTMGYDSKDRVIGVTDPGGRLFGFGYDDADRIVSQQIPGRGTASYSYDAAGNLIGFTPPGRPLHAFEAGSEDQLSAYIAPPLASLPNTTGFSYDLDGQIDLITRPGGATIDWIYDEAGRLRTLAYSGRTVTMSYDSTTGRMSHMVGSDGQSTAHTWDGRLPMSESWTGDVNGTLSRTYDSNFRVVTQSVNGGSTVAYGYDEDALLTSAGVMTISRYPDSGFVHALTVGQIVEDRVFDSFGNVRDVSAVHSGSQVYRLDIRVRDVLGRIEEQAETIQGVVVVWSYSYRPDGSLWQVMKDGSLVSSYQYDSNGNRLGGPGLATPPVYDDQDRLKSYGDWQFDYTASGELARRTETSTSRVTSYAYDALGSLRSVSLPDGRFIEYVVDPQGRRVGKKIDGVLTRGWLYSGEREIVAELDGSGAVTARFVAGSYFTKAGATYRLIRDQRGSVRLVVNAATGAVIQRLDYDEFGRVTLDTNPEFQPMGFGGGLYDADTGLVRLGARDYDASVGRWTAKDPSLFAGRDTNLYGYALNDPINLVDPEGRAAVAPAPVLSPGPLTVAPQGPVAAVVGAALIGYWIGDRLIQPLVGPHIDRMIDNWMGTPGIGPGWQWAPPPPIKPVPGPAPDPSTGGDGSEPPDTCADQCLPYLGRGKRYCGNDGHMYRNGPGNYQAAFSRCYDECMGFK